MCDTDHSAMQDGWLPVWLQSARWAVSPPSRLYTSWSLTGLFFISRWSLIQMSQSCRCSNFCLCIHLKSPERARKWTLRIVFQIICLATEREEDVFNQFISNNHWAELFIIFKVALRVILKTSEHQVNSHLRLWFFKRRASFLLWPLTLSFKSCNLSEQTTTLLTC